MATESPMRMVESSQTSEWLSSKDTAAFRPLFKSKATEELGFFMKSQKFNQDQADLVPSQVGSAPPSMEGSCAAVGNMLTMKDSSPCSNSANLGYALDNCNSEGRWLIDPSYVAYSSPDVNLYPRLPPRHLGNQIGSHKENHGRISSDNGGTGSLHMYSSPLSTHKNEADKENSPEHAFENLAEDSSILKLGQNAALSGSRHKSLVDLIQEDFPRTPSPVYNQSHMSSHATTEDSADAYVHAISSSVSSINITNLSNSATCCSVLETGVLSVDSCESISKEDPPETFASSQHADETKTSPDGQSCNENEALKDDVSTNGVMGKEDHKLKASNAEVRRHKQEQHYCPNNLKSLTHGYPYQVPGLDVQFISQGTNNSQSYLGKLAHSHALFSSVPAQQSLPSLGLSGPLFATPTTFVTSGNPFYPNFHPSALFSPQYSLGGYAMSSVIFPPYMTRYSSHGAMPLPIEATYGPNLNGQGTSVSSGEGIPHAGDFQNRRKFYGQLESSPQPSYGDPLSIPYCPRPFDVAYTTAFQQNQLASRILTGGQVPPQDSAVTAYLDGQAFQPPVNGGLSIPFFPSSSMSVNNPVGRQNGIKMPQVSGRSAALCSRDRGISSFGDQKKQSFIEELKSINSGKFELSNIAGRIVEFSTDQHGSRFIQQKLESSSAQEKISVFEEVLPHASKLMTDVFSNYVIQKFFEHGSPDQRKKLADQLAGQMLPLSLQMYGCRVIQKALEVIELDQKTRLVQELDGDVMRCVCDQNGNHVIQKCIECIPIDKVKFIIFAFKGQVPTLSTHPYGCRVIQRVLEHCSGEEHIQCIVDEILESTCVLAQDQYGNYVTQHVLERGKPHERSQIISKLTGKIVQMSQHKYASNVIEKCLVHGNAIERERLVEEIIGQPGESNNLLTMMKDQFGNYVVQKILEISNDWQRERLLDHIRVHLHALKKYTYGKHIVARFEQFAGPGGRDDP